MARRKPKMFALITLYADSTRTDVLDEKTFENYDDDEIYYKATDWINETRINSGNEEIFVTSRTTVLYSDVHGNPHETITILDYDHNGNLYHKNLRMKIKL